MTNILTIKFGWNQMKIGRGVVSFENSKIGNFAKCTEWPQTKLKESDIKGTLHMCTVALRLPNFRPFRFTISRFQDIAHFTIFPFTPMLKFQSATKFFGRSAKHLWLYFPYDCLIDHKVWLRSVQNCRSSVLESVIKESGSRNRASRYPIIYVHCSTQCTVAPRVTNFRPFRSTISHFQDIAHFTIFPLTPMLKFQSATKCLILTDYQNIYMTLYSLIAALLIIKFGSDRIKTVGVAFWNFQPHMVLC